MSVWVIAAATLVAVYATGLALLFAFGRRTDAAAVARLVPDCARLAGRLARDPRVPRRRRLALLALVAYLLMPIDLVPDVIPVVGVLDDALLVVLVLRGVVRGAGPGVLAEHWPGPPRGLELLERALGG